MRSVGAKDFVRFFFEPVTLNRELTDFLLESLDLRVLTGDFLVLCCRPLLKDRLCPFLEYSVPRTQSCRGYLVLLGKLIEGLIPSQKIQDYLRFKLC